MREGEAPLSLRTVVLRRGLLAGLVGLVLAGVAFGLRLPPPEWPSASSSSSPAASSWREEYRKLARTILRPGDTLRVRLLEGGRPRPGLPVACVNAAGPKRVFETTDADGKITIRLAHPGPWLLAATVLRPVDRADLEWQSEFATLTFAVGKP